MARRSLLSTVCVAIIDDSFNGNEQLARRVKPPLVERSNPKCGNRGAHCRFISRHASVGSRSAAPGPVFTRW